VFGVAKGISCATVRISSSSLYIYLFHDYVPLFSSEVLPKRMCNIDAVPFLSHFSVAEFRFALRLLFLQCLPR